MTLTALDPGPHTHRVPVDHDGAADWRHLLEHDREALIELLHEMKALLYRWPVVNPFVWLLAKGAYVFYRRSGHFVAESDLLAERTGVLSAAEMAFCQRQYTWSHVGCSTAAIWDEARGHMLCMRSLDWPAAAAIAKATRYFEFQDPHGRTLFRAASLTGMVGVLTGVRPGGFSVVLNFAKAPLSARRRSDPTFLIRKLLSDPQVRNWHDAVLAVLQWEVGAPCFITMCGIGRDEACVVEFPPYGRAPRIRRIGASGVLVQTNHYDPDGSFGALNRHDPAARPPPGEDWYAAKLMVNSGLRRARIEAGLRALAAAPGDALEQRALELWKQAPVFNYETAHVVAMRPATGELAIWNRAG
ncbi:MAG: hypothetical protein AB7Q97_23110 [Gammaproteobacteria bacterium]